MATPKEKSNPSKVRTIEELYQTQKGYFEKLKTMTEFLEKNKVKLRNSTNPEEFNIYLENLKAELVNSHQILKTAESLRNAEPNDPNIFIRLTDLAKTVSSSKQSTALCKDNFQHYVPSLLKVPELDKMWSAHFKGKPPAAFNSYAIEPVQIPIKLNNLTSPILEELLNKILDSDKASIKNLLQDSMEDLLSAQDLRIEILKKQFKSIKEGPKSSTKQQILEIMQKMIDNETAKREALSELTELPMEDQIQLKDAIKKISRAYGAMPLMMTSIDRGENDFGLAKIGFKDIPKEALPDIKKVLLRLRESFDNQMIAQAQVIADNVNNNRKRLNIFAFIIPTRAAASFIANTEFEPGVPLAVNNLRMQFLEDESALRAQVSKYNIQLTNPEVAINQFKAIVQAGLPAPQFSKTSHESIIKYLDQSITKMREQITIPITTSDPTLAAQQLGQSIKMGFIPVVTHPEIFNPPLPKSLENLTFEIQSKKRSVCIEQIRALAAAGANFRLKDQSMGKEIPVADYFTKSPELRVLAVRCLNPEEALKRMQNAANLGFIPVLDTDSRKELMKFQGKSQRDLDIITRYLSWNDSPEAQAHHPNYQERARVNKSIKENQAKLSIAQAASNQPEVNKLQAKIALLKQKREQLEAGLKAEVVFKNEVATLSESDQKFVASVLEKDRKFIEFVKDHYKTPEERAEKLAEMQRNRLADIQKRKKGYGDLVTVPITTTNLGLASQQIQRLLEQGCSFTFTHPKMEKDLKAFLKNEEVVINTGDLRNVVPLFQKALDIGFIPKLGRDTEADYFNSLKAGRGQTRLAAVQVHLSGQQDPVRVVQAILDLGAIPVIPAFLKDSEAEALLRNLQKREREVAKKGQQNVLQLKGPLDNIPHALRIYETVLNMGLHPEISDDLAKAIQAEAIKQEALKEKFTEAGVKKGAGQKQAPKGYNPLPELRLKNITFDSFAKLASLGVWSPTLAETSGKKTERYFSESFVKAIVADLKKQFDADNSKTTFFVELPGNSKNDVLYKNMSSAVVELGRAVMEELKGSKKYNQITVVPQDNEKIRLGLTQPKTTAVAKPTQQMYGQHLAEAALKRRIPPPPARKQPKIAPDKPPE